MTEARTVLQLVVFGGCSLRMAAVLFGWSRTFLNRRRFTTYKMGLAEALVAVELPVLAGVMAYLATTSLMPTSASPAELIAAAAGAALVLAGWDMTIWSFFSWRAMFSGHGVLADHTLVTTGAYGLVRHPAYLGVLLFWLGLSTAFLSLVAFLLTVLYVFPAFLLYIRSEEAMMVEEFKETYARYRASVPMLLPRLGRPGG